VRIEGPEILSRPGVRLYVLAAWSGALLLFAGPVLALLANASPLLAAILGYSGIALFTGGVGARFDFATARSPISQLLKNLLMGIVVSGVFFLIFLLVFNF